MNPEFNRQTEDNGNKGLSNQQLYRLIDRFPWCDEEISPCEEITAILQYKGKDRTIFDLFAGIEIRDNTINSRITQWVDNPQNLNDLFTGGKIKEVKIANHSPTSSIYILEAIKNAVDNEYNLNSFSIQLDKDHGRSMLSFSRNKANLYLKKGFKSEGIVKSWFKKDCVPTYKGEFKSSQCGDNLTIFSVEYK